MASASEGLPVFFEKQESFIPDDNFNHKFNTK